MSAAAKRTAERRRVPLPALLLALAATLLAAAPVGRAQAFAAETREPARNPAAQEWSVQVVALRDLREADAVVGQLRRLGFDAYSEFAMSGGRQFVRVRIGCSVGREGADALAAVLADTVTTEAVPVPREADAAPRACLERTVGFLTPSGWGAVAPGAYRVAIAGREGVIVHDGQRWRVRQGDPEALGGTRGPRVPAGFAAAEVGGRPVVLAPAAAGGGVLCPGRLLHDLGSVAIVHDGAAVVACQLRGAPRGGAAR